MAAPSELLRAHFREQKWAATAATLHRLSKIDRREQLDERQAGSAFFLQKGDAAKQDKLAQPLAPSAVGECQCRCQYRAAARSIIKDGGKGGQRAQLAPPSALPVSGPLFSLLAPKTRVLGTRSWPESGAPVAS